MRQLYLFIFLCLLASGLSAQVCDSIQFTSTSMESRCMATGSITVNASGGSGSYNYRVVGPVNKPFTSSHIITGLSAGYYQVIVEDVNRNCTLSKDSVWVPGTYQDPRFTLAKTNVSCAGNDGSISLVDQQFGRSPFTYSIIAPSPSRVGTSSTSGNFTGLVAGEYFVQLQDSCGGIQVRRITIDAYNWWFDQSSVTRVGCDSADATVILRDNRGNINNSGPGFAGFTYGVVRAAGDTSWYLTYNFRFYLGTGRSVTLVAKDPCGKIFTSYWQLPSSQVPSIGSVSLGTYGCISFTATVSAQQNLTNPQFCLLNSSNAVVACNTTGVFTSIPYGNYCIRMTDDCYDTVIQRCFTATKPKPSVASSVTITNQNCSTFTASVHGWSNLTNPQFCLLDDANVSLGCNTSGVFNNVPYGIYCIRVRNGCSDTIIMRCFTVTRPVPTLNPPTISGVNCNSFNLNVTGNNLNGTVTYCLYDSLGNVDTCNTTGFFTGIGHGNYCVKATTSCGDTTSSVCVSSAAPRPAVSATVQTSSLTCTGFTATVTGQQNLSNPRYCLLNAASDTLECNGTGVFTGLPYGNYCIAIRDGCVDTTIVRCFSQAQVMPSINATIQQYNMACATFTAKLTGNNLTDPQYCVYDSFNNLLQCNTTGVFDNLAYGEYCFRVTDGCVDTTFTLCKTFVPHNDLSLTTSKSCSINFANVNAQFDSPNAPYGVKVYYPDGSLYMDTSASTNPVRMLLPALPAGQQFKIVGTDGCGLKDSAYIAPDATLVTRSVTVQAKCPTATWVNGSGDLRVSCHSNLYTVLPAIVKKNGAAYQQSFSSQSNGAYTFADLEPADYVVEYALQSCDSRVYDTVSVLPYTYPTQGQSAIYQCDNNSFSVAANVEGGINPYTYQIIGSNPSYPSITSTQVDNPVFNINNGTVYSLVRLRTIDHCGNATLADVSVLPLQNISVVASENCFYRNVTLTVDTLPNASYTWYRKTTSVDSTVIGSGLSYNLPFFRPEQVGVYICKVNVNNGCITRQASFNLDGDCDNVILPMHWNLSGRSSGSSNKLTWTVQDEKDVMLYTVEQKKGTQFVAIGSVSAGNTGTSSQYQFVDAAPGAGSHHYRVRMTLVNGRVEYSNTIVLSSGGSSLHVYPNPVKQQLHIDLYSDQKTDYHIELVNPAGQKVYTKDLKDIRQTTLICNRHHLPTGIYFLKVRDMKNNSEEIRKIVLE